MLRRDVFPLMRRRRISLPPIPGSLKNLHLGIEGHGWEGLHVQAPLGYGNHVRPAELPMATLPDRYLPRAG